MEGFSQVRVWNEKNFEAMHRFFNAELNAFQPYNHSFQQHVGMPQFFQPSVGNPNPSPPISEMVLTRSKRKVVEDEEDDDVQIVTPSAPKKKTTTKKVTNKTMMKEEGETEEDKKHWKDADVEVMIALRGEMEPEFLKNAKKTRCVDFFCCVGFFQH